MDDYLLNCMMVICIVGILIKIIFGRTTYSNGVQGPAAAALCGYGVVSIAVILLIIVSSGLASNAPSRIETNSKEFIMIMIKNCLPSILTLWVIMWLMSINYIYYERINQGEVSSEYNSFSTASTLLILIQIGVLFKYLTNENKKQGSGSSMINAVYVLTILNMMFAGIMNIIVMYFSTDG